MDSLTSPAYSRLPQTSEGSLQMPQSASISKADPIATTESTKEPKAVLEVVNCEDQCPDPDLTSPSYKTVSTVRSAIKFGSIIVGNCLCSGCICLCLRSYSSINNLSQGEKRAFNTISLLLSASLGFSVGFLFDQIGLLARGTFLQRKCHSMEEIGHIVRGTLSSYALLFMHRIRTRQGLVAPTTWVLFVFLLCSVAGRFGVALLGFAFNLDDTSFVTSAYFRPDWVNGTMNMILASESSRTSYAQVSLPQDIRDVAKSISMQCQTAQLQQGLPWLESHLHWFPSEDISYFAKPDFNFTIIQASDRQTISFRYKFKDFQGTNATFAGWEAHIETSCQAAETTNNDTVPISAFNFTDPGSYRWIYPLDLNGITKYDSENSVLRNSTIKICFDLWADGLYYLGLAQPSARDLEYYEKLFNCTIYFVDSPTSNSRPVPSLDVHDTIPILQRPDILAPGVHILGKALHSAIRLGPAGILLDSKSDGTIGREDFFRDFYPTPRFTEGVDPSSWSDGSISSMHNQRIAERWLAAYIGNYIGSCLDYLNVFLDRVVIDPEKSDVRIKLFVEWKQVSGILGGLVVFQVVFGLAALVYCRRKFEIVDDVSTFSSMLRDFPFRPKKERILQSAVHQGKFVPEGDGFRWVAVVTGKDSEVE